MYAASGGERLIPLDPELPTMDVGAPIPVVASTEHVAVVAYYAGLSIQEARGDEDAVAGVVFERLTALMFGPPNEEALHGHPLYAAGLEFYTPAEVVGSPWVARLEEINGVHEHHLPGIFSGRHIIVPFHDRTFECICSEVSVHGVDSGTTRAVAARVLAGLAAG